MARLSSNTCWFRGSPGRSVAALDSYCAYAPTLEEEILPQKDDLVRAIREIAEF